MATNPNDYEHDFYTWTFEQARRLREGRLLDIDREHIAEELEDMGRREKRTLEHQLSRLLAHLLKWQYQPDRHSPSWRASIRDAREEVQHLLAENPGLKSKLPECFARAYSGGVNWAVVDSGLAESTFPDNCPWSLEQALDGGYWP
jgi:hypothetical protein